MDRACSTYGRRAVVFRGLVRKPEGKRPLGNPGVDERIILRWIFRKWDVGALIDYVRYGTSQPRCT